MADKKIDPQNEAVSQAEHEANAHAAILEDISLANENSKIAALTAIYTLYKESLINSRYYGCKLHRAQNLNMWFEIVLAVGATGSGVAGWSLWSEGSGKLAWALLAGIASLLAVVKPLIGVSNKIERYSKLFASYQQIYTRSRILVLRICVSRQVTADHRRSFDNMFRTALDLAALDEPRPSKKLIEQVTKEADKLIPPSSLWWPDNDRIKKNDKLGRASKDSKEPCKEDDVALESRKEDDASVVSIDAARQAGKVQADIG